MANDLSVCGQVGGNTGGIKCAVSPGRPQSWAIYLGSLTPTQQQSAALLKAAMIADSKKSKSSTSKLFLMPPIIDRAKQKEANTEQTFSSGLKVVTREGLPGWRWGFKTSAQQLEQLRKFNGLVLPIIFTDNKQNTWGTVDGDDNFVGRQASIFFEGLDGADDATDLGIGYVTVGFIDAVESYDEQFFVKNPWSWQSILKGLIDVQLVEKATASLSGATAPTATVTMTAVGGDGDTINILKGSTSLTGGAVTKTSSETTVTLLAALIKAAINAATGTNGGYTADNTAGVLTITGPSRLGASINADTLTVTIVGTMTKSQTAFASGVTGSTTLHLSATMDTKEAGNATDIYSNYSTSALGTDKTLYKVTKVSTGAVLTLSSVAPNASGYFDLNIGAQVPDDYVVDLVAPDTLDASLVVGIEGIPFTYTR
jgi:hypothetical protein